MSPEVRLSSDEAVDLLNKWKNEDRVIHLSIMAGSVFAKSLGRIDAVAPDKLLFSAAKSTNPLGKYYLAEIPLSGGEFEYLDAKDAAEPQRSRLKGYEALLYIRFRDAVGKLQIAIGFAVVPPFDEWVKL